MSNLRDQLEELLTDFVAKATGRAKDDVKKYGKAIAKDFEKFLMKAYVDGEESAMTELRLLRGELKVLAAKHMNFIASAAMEFVQETLEIIAKVAMTALVKFAK